MITHSLTNGWLSSLSASQPRSLSIIDNNRSPPPPDSASHRPASRPICSLSAQQVQSNWSTAANGALASGSHPLPSRPSAWLRRRPIERPDWIATERPSSGVRAPSGGASNQFDLSCSCFIIMIVFVSLARIGIWTRIRMRIRMRIPVRIQSAGHRAPIRLGATNRKQQNELWIDVGAPFIFHFSCSALTLSLVRGIGKRMNPENTIHHRARGAMVERMEENKANGVEQRGEWFSIPLNTDEKPAADPNRTSAGFESNLALLRGILEIPASRRAAEEEGLVFTWLGALDERTHTHTGKRWPLDQVKVWLRTAMAELRCASEMWPSVESPALRDQLNGSRFIIWSIVPLAAHQLAITRPDDNDGRDRAFLLFASPAPFVIARPNWPSLRSRGATRTECMFIKCSSGCCSSLVADYERSDGESDAAHEMRIQATSVCMLSNTANDCDVSPIAIGWWSKFRIPVAYGQANGRWQGSAQCLVFIWSLSSPLSHFIAHLFNFPYWRWFFEPHSAHHPSARSTSGQRLEWVQLASLLAKELLHPGRDASSLASVVPCSRTAARPNDR